MHFRRIVAVWVAKISSLKGLPKNLHPCDNFSGAILLSAKEETVAAQKTATKLIGLARHCQTTNDDQFVFVSVLSN